jgi:hypothetical protein
MVADCSGAAAGCCHVFIAPRAGRKPLLNWDGVAKLRSRRSFSPLRLPHTDHRGAVACPQESGSYLFSKYFVQVATRISCSVCEASGQPVYRAPTAGWCAIASPWYSREWLASVQAKHLIAATSVKHSATWHRQRDGRYRQAYMWGANPGGRPELAVLTCRLCKAAGFL